MNNSPRIPTSGVCIGGFPSTPLRLVSQLREAAQLLRRCPAEGAPGARHSPSCLCVCVYRLRNNTALSASLKATGTKCLSERACGPTRYNPIKRFTAGQCSSRARSLEPGIKQSVLRFQEQCQEQGLRFRLGQAGVICAAGGSGGSLHTSPPLIRSSSSTSSQPGMAGRPSINSSNPPP